MFACVWACDLANPCYFTWYTLSDNSYKNTLLLLIFISILDVLLLFHLADLRYKTYLYLNNEPWCIYYGRIHLIHKVNTIKAAHCAWQCVLDLRAHTVNEQLLSAAARQTHWERHVLRDSRWALRTLCGICGKGVSWADWGIFNTSLPSLSSQPRTQRLCTVN